MQELLDSGYLTEVHKFSKFIHGTATLFPDMVGAQGWYASCSLALVRVVSYDRHPLWHRISAAQRSGVRSHCRSGNPLLLLQWCVL